MNPKLTIGVILAGFVVGTAYGPLGTLTSITREQMQDAGYWLDMLASTVRSAATTGMALGGVVASALGIPIWQGRKAGGENTPP
jgi:hypothetical protein